MQPSVGRMVYYKSFGSPGGEHPSVERAAIITAVHNDTCVDLCVLNPTGLFFSPKVIQGPVPGKWDWMPYQKGQAAKTEELEMQLAAVESSGNTPKLPRSMSLADFTKQMGDPFDFGLAIHFLKLSYKVAREGWNGKGMYLVYIPRDAWHLQLERTAIQSEDISVGQDWIAIRTANGSLSPWTVSQADMLASDWRTVL